MSKNAGAPQEANFKAMFKLKNKALGVTANGKKKSGFIYGKDEEAKKRWGVNLNYLQPCVKLWTFMGQNKH